MAASGCAELGRRALIVGLTSGSLVGATGCVVREGAEPQPFVPTPDEGDEEVSEDGTRVTAALRSQV